VALVPVNVVGRKGARKPGEARKKPEEQEKPE
jgi:hypothetical protein